MGAAREVGLFEPQHAAFMDYYIRFIGHFISVYSSKSPPFTRESARWSANSENIQRYLLAGNRMSDVIDQPVEEALMTLPQEERYYTRSRLPVFVSMTCMRLPALETRWARHLLVNLSCLDFIFLSRRSASFFALNLYSRYLRSCIVAPKAVFT